MNIYKSIIIFFIASIMCCTACQNSNDTPEEAVIEVETIKDIDLSAYSEKLRTIVKTDSGVLRGINFNTSVVEAKDTESGIALDSSDALCLDYLFNIGTMEEAEVLYFFGNEKKINKIQLNIYPANSVSQDSLYQELDHYFSEKYGNSETRDLETGITWNTQDYKVVMKKTGNRKVDDIRVDFTLQ